MRTPLRRLTLQPGERLLRVAKASLTLPIALYVFLIAIPLGLYAFTEHTAFLYGSLGVLLIGAGHILHRMQFMWVITNQRTIARWGILTTHTTSVSHNRITDTSATIPLLAGAFGTGSVRISTASNDDIQIKIASQHTPLRIQQLLNNLKGEASQNHA